LQGADIAYDVPAEILQQTTKCPSEFSCLRSDQCGDRPLCDVERAYSKEVLCLRADDWISCPYHLDFGGAKICLCPVRCWIHRQP